MFHCSRPKDSQLRVKLQDHYFLTETVEQWTIVARVRVRGTGAAAPGARTAAPGFPVSPAWVRQAVYLDNSGFTS